MRCLVVGTTAGGSTAAEKGGLKKNTDHSTDAGGEGMTCNKLLRWAALPEATLSNAMETNHRRDNRATDAGTAKGGIQTLAAVKQTGCQLGCNKSLKSDEL